MKTELNRDADQHMRCHIDAWDRYAAAAITALVARCDPISVNNKSRRIETAKEIAEVAKEIAEEMMAVRLKRFGADTAR